MKSICFDIIGYVWTCFAVSSVTFLGTFGSVNVNLFRGVCREFRSNEIVKLILGESVGSHEWFIEYF